MNTFSQNLKPPTELILFGEVFVVLVVMLLIGMLIYRFKNGFFIPVSKPKTRLKFDITQEDLVLKYYPFYASLNIKYRLIFQDRCLRFLQSISFKSPPDFHLLPEDKLLIVASWIQVSFGFSNYKPAELKYILVFKNYFFSTITKRQHKGELNLGQGVIAFSLEDFMSDLKCHEEPNHLGFHEFSHLLHFHCMLHKSQSYAARYCINFMYLKQYLSKNNRLQSLKEAHFFRNYAFVNEVEFMAVLMENFFTNTDSFFEHHPELFVRVQKMLGVKAKYFLTAVKTWFFFN